jgi:hypothetical protein
VGMSNVVSHSKKTPETTCHLLSDNPSEKRPDFVRKIGREISAVPQGEGTRKRLPLGEVG